MNIFKLTTLAMTVGALTAPIAASAGSSSKTTRTAQDCRLVDGRALCPPKTTERVVPEYFSVPTRTRHIQYDRPNVQPPLVEIIHHVPVPVYDGQNVIERVNGGQWTGPNYGCCEPQSAPPVQYAPPLRYAPQIAQPVARPTAVYCYRGSPSRYGSHGQNLSHSAHKGC